MRHKAITVAFALCILLVSALVLSLILGRKENLNSVEVVKNHVGKHYLLPSGEQPALATITDKKKLSSQFLRQADNGDKVLIYQKNQIAIIYRPQLDRIVAVGPVSIDTPPTSQ